MLYMAEGSRTSNFDRKTIEGLVNSALDSIGNRRRVLALPPDITRLHSFAGHLTAAVQSRYRDALAHVMPAVGTHEPMSDAQIQMMYPGVPREKFVDHNWKTDVVELGRIDAAYIGQLSGGRLDYDWPAQVNRRLVEGGYDLILSIGQVLPHEVVGMANFTKNVFVGTGGSEAIHKSHYLSAIHGIERTLGRADTPVRRLFNKAAREYASGLPIVYMLTVVEAAADGPTVRGLFVGDDEECFERAADLAALVNVTTVAAPLPKVVAYLDPDEFRSTWLGNKAVYRTRMAIADGGELIILAPGIHHFGEDAEIDRLIRKHGYRTTAEVLERVDGDTELAASLGAAAHLIHGSSEGRFTVTYAPGKLSRAEIEGVGYQYADLAELAVRYPVDSLKPGPNTLADGEEIYYVPIPGLGLWTTEERMR